MSGTPLALAIAGLDELLARPLSEADLDRATAALAAPLEEHSAERLSLLAVRAGGELLALPAREAARVAPPLPVHRVPHRTNEVFRGIANHDGELLLCMSIEAALGLPAPARREGGALVVAEHGRERWAFAVDRVIGVVDVDGRTLRAPPMTVSGAKSGCVRALVRLEEGEAAVLDAAGLCAVFRGAAG